MNFEDFLKQLQPNLTVVAALFGFLLLFIKLFWFFLTYEGTIREENLSRVKDLLLGFRKRNIEVKFKDLYNELKLEGYTWAINSIVTEIYPIEFNTDEGKNTRKLKVAADIEKVLDEKNLSEFIKSAENLIKKDSADFVYSKRGEDFFTVLDKLYEQKMRMHSVYHTMKIFCRVTWWSCLILAVLSILGIIVKLSCSIDWIAHFWLFTYISVFLIGLASFILLFYKRSKLIGKWELQQLFGDEKE